jgi:hypothetical protein
MLGNNKFAICFFTFINKMPTTLLTLVCTVAQTGCWAVLWNRNRNFLTSGTGTVTC